MIKTTYKTAKRAAEDIVEKLNKELVDFKVQAAIYERDGHPMIGLDFAFDAALGFIDGSGIFGYEGFGNCGPVFDNEGSAVVLEAYNSVELGVYAR